MLAEAPKNAIPDRIRRNFSLLDDPGLSAEEYNNARNRVVVEYDAWLDSIGLPAPEKNQQQFNQLAAESTKPEIYYHGLGIPAWVSGKPIIINGIRLLAVAGISFIVARGFTNRDGENIPSQETPPITVQETDQVTKIRYEKPNPAHADIKAKHGKDVTGIPGQVMALVGQKIYGSDPFSDRPGYDKASTEDRDFRERGRLINNWMVKENSRVVVQIEDQFYFLTQDAQGRPVEIAIPRNFAEVAGTYTPKADSIPEPAVAAGIPAQAEPTATTRPDVRGGVPHLGQSYNAENPNAFVCPGIKSEAQLLNLAKSGCLNESLKKQNFDISRLTEANLYRGNTTEQDLVKAADKFGVPVEALRAALPLSRQGEVYVARINEKGEKVLGKINFNFTDGNRFDLKSLNKTLPRTYSLTYVYQEGKIVLVLDLCGNVIPGQEIPKAVPSTTPTPREIPTSTSTATTIVFAPTATSTATPTATVEHFFIPTPGPTVPEVPVAPVPGRPGLPPEQRPFIPPPLEVCINDARVTLNPDQLYREASLAGYNGSPFDIPAMQRHLFDVTCRRLPPPPPPQEYILCVDRNFIRGNILYLYNLAYNRYGYRGPIDINEISAYLARTCEVVVTPVTTPTPPGATSTATGTPGPTSTRTATPATPASSPTGTNTPDRTPTATPTNTPRPGETPSVTATSTPTVFIPGATATETTGPTSTRTATPATPESSPTGTNTPVSTNTPTAAASATLQSRPNTPTAVPSATLQERPNRPAPTATLGGR